MQITEGENGTTEAVLTCEKGVDIKEALALAMLQNGCLILRLEENRASLEDVFIELTAQQPAVPVPQADAAEAGTALEVDAQTVLDGTAESAYDAYAPFDKPADEPETPDDHDEPDMTAQEGGEDDAGNV